MSGDQIASLLYMLMLGVAVVGWFVAQNRASLGKVLQQALIWVFIFLGAIAGVGLWQDISNTVVPRQSIQSNGALVLPADEAGHFNLTAVLNGAPVAFLVDTGATDVVLSQADAKRAGLAPETLDHFGRAFTANGVAATAQATIDEFELGAAKLRNVRVSVNKGDLNQSLLGMNLLNQFSKVEISDGEMRLTP